MSVSPIKVKLLIQLTNLQIVARTKYLLGAKAPSLESKQADIERIDCSGEVRWLVYQASDGKTVMPDGSVNQRVWCEEQQLHELVNYSDVSQADESRVFICFIRPKNGKCGHVWIVQGLRTIESHFGRGVARRHWATKVLSENCVDTFELPTE